MSEEQEKKETQTIIGPKTEEEILRDLKQAENSEENLKREAALAGSIANVEKKEMTVKYEDDE